MSRKVLVMEDAVFIREIEKRFLRNTDCEIVGETNSETEGLKIFKSKKPDLVILDLHLAEGSGLSALKGLREINPDAKILVVTSYNEELEQNKELRSQVSAVLTKPFTEEEFTSAINSLF